MSSIAINRAAPASPLVGSVTSALVFPLISNPLLAATVYAPGKLAIEQKKFTLRGEGNAVVSVNTTTVKPTLYGALTLPASPLTAANWTALAAGAAVAISTSTLTAPWWIQADLIFDSTGGFLQGIWSQLVNNAWTAPAALGNQLGPGINGTNQNVSQASTVYPPADPVIVFAVGLTFSAGNAGNAGNLANFEVSF
jgi:hypothetical protein